MNGPQWLDVEAVLVGRLTELLPARVQNDPDLAPLASTLGVSVSTTADLEGRLFVRVNVVGGSDDGLNDSAMVDVEAFAPGRDLASTLAAVARQTMLDLAGTDASADGRQLIDTVRTSTRPRWVDYRNTKVQRYVASYWVTNRLQ